MRLLCALLLMVCLVVQARAAPGPTTEDLALLKGALATADVYGKSHFSYAVFSDNLTFDCYDNKSMAAVVSYAASKGIKKTLHVVPLIKILKDNFQEAAMKLKKYIKAEGSDLLLSVKQAKSVGALTWGVAGYVIYDEIGNVTDKVPDEIYLDFAAVLADWPAGAVKQLAERTITLGKDGARQFSITHINVTSGNCYFCNAYDYTCTDTNDQDVETLQPPALASKLAKLTPIIANASTFKAAGHEGFTLFPEGPAFDCLDNRTHAPMAAYLMSKNVTGTAWLLDVTDNRDTTFAKAAAALTATVDKLNLIETIEAYGPAFHVPTWTLGGTQAPKKLNLNLGILAADWTETAVRNYLKNVLKLWKGQEAGTSTVKVDAATGTCKECEYVKGQQSLQCSDLGPQ